MIISEKQIMHLITLAHTYAEELTRSSDMMKQVRSHQITILLSDINNQQSEELKVVE